MQLKWLDFGIGVGPTFSHVQRLSLPGEKNNHKVAEQGQACGPAGMWS